MKFSPEAAALLYSYLSELSESKEQSIMDRLVSMHRGAKWSSEDARALIAEASALRAARDAAKRDMTVSRGKHA